VPVVQHQHHQGPVADNAGQDNQHDDGHPLFALIGRQMGEKYLPRVFYKIFSHGFRTTGFLSSHPHMAGSKSCLLEQTPYQLDHES
jgi:hypothetical protein